MTLHYARDLAVGRRRRTRAVEVGDVGVGGTNPIRVQSMTTTDTRDTPSTVDQIERLADVGCEIVRLAVPSITDAENLRDIRAELARRKVGVPLVADIHFTPNAAMVAADFVEKVRINPGNYADKKRFEVREYTDAEYRVEVERAADRFRPLVRRCLERGVAMRIGTNHGSLSDRVMNRHGDTPLGMVESALEFLDVCEEEGFRDVIFSMKASNTQVAIQAYRLLAARLDERNRADSYPFHVGVTEAGDGEDGRVKSAIGIGALLEDGIGDTLRVSLTEDPLREVPVAYALARRAEVRWGEDEALARLAFGEPIADPYHHERRASETVQLSGLEVGGRAPVRVELDLGSSPNREFEAWAALVGASLSGLRDVACEGIQLRLEKAADLDQAPVLHANLNDAGLDYPLALSLPVATDLDAFGRDLGGVLSRLVFEVDSGSTDASLEAALRCAQRAHVAAEWCFEGEVAEIPEWVARTARLSDGGATSFLFSTRTPRAAHAARVLVTRLHAEGLCGCGVVLRTQRHESDDDATAALAAAIDLGTPLCDGIGDVVSLTGFRDPARAVDLGYRVLQGARLRVTRTEYISCPSCGRTLFDLEAVTARIKRKTEHLRGVKIAVMGCIVNGPGEMADADFGYVGSGPGRVTLYVGQEVRVRNVAEAEAPDRLVELIRESGRWQDA